MSINYLSSNLIRLLCKLSFSIVFAIIINHYLLLTNLYWLLLPAILVSLPTRGSQLRKGFIFLIILLAIVIAVQFFVPISLQDRAIDIMLGVTIGIWSQFIWPINLAKEFRADILPILQAMIHYLEAMITDFSHDTHAKNIFEKKVTLEKLLTKRKIYPEWIFSSGFNPGLRAGFRFFLIRLDQVIELLLILNYQLHRQRKHDIDPPVLDFIIKSLHINVEILLMLVKYFKHNQINNTQSDYASDIAALEKSFWQMLPGNLELLDLAEEFLVLAALIRNVKDTRGCLLKLANALPEPE